MTSPTFLRIGRSASRCRRRARAQDDNPEASPSGRRCAQACSSAADRPAAEDVSLDAPVRAEDAAIVPIAIKTRFPQTPERYIDKIYLIIDNNPSPISAIFKFTPHSGRADIETRVRIDEYTHVRAIAETNDGGLHMSTPFRQGLRRLFRAARQGAAGGAGNARAT